MRGLTWKIATTIVSACMGVSVHATQVMASSQQQPRAVETNSAALSASIEDNTPIRTSETHIVPSLRVAERYDSNVYFLPGRQLEDFVTTISPQMRVEHKNRLVNGFISGGASAEVFVKNPGLNYVSLNGTVDMTLNGIVQELASGLRLHISDTFLFTPQLPSFAAPVADSQLPESFLRGLQAQRANATTNAGKIDLGYVFSPTLALNASYADQRIRFANTFAPTPTAPIGSLIDTTIQTLEAGPAVTLTPTDTLRLAYVHQQGSFNFGDFPTSFTTQGATASWTRSIATNLEVTGMGGFAVLSTHNAVQPVAAASLKWQEGLTSVSLSYTRMIVPSFLFVPIPLVSQVVNGTITRKLSQVVSVSVGASYAVNYSVPDPSILNMTSYTVTPSINYAIGKTATASLSYAHSEFEQKIVAQSYQFDRNVVMLSLTMEWK